MSKTEVPIMLLFFNRPDTLAKVFEWVRNVKPKQLFLVQDGAREDRPDDKEKIMQCRKIVEAVDWDCEVRKNYSEINLTCDHREYTGIDWCFEYVDRLMVLEDDCLPALSFYNFCGELLEKYKNDERVHMISGFNRCNHYTKTPYDYVFSVTGAGIGWATWRRVWKEVKNIAENPLFLTEEEFVYYNTMLNKMPNKSLKNLLPILLKAKEANQRENKIHSWELLVGARAFLQSALTITPAKNMIKYIGITEDATHCYADPNLLSPDVRKMLTQCSYELSFPIKHPPYVVEDVGFTEADNKAYQKKNKYLKKNTIVDNCS